jgi:hypothetical protein
MPYDPGGSNKNKYRIDGIYSIVAGQLAGVI